MGICKTGFSEGTFLGSFSRSIIFEKCNWTKMAQIKNAFLVDNTQVHLFINTKVNILNRNFTNV